MEVWNDELNELIVWIDQFELTRPKKNLNRDFSDGVLVAEILKHYYPNRVELHNYPSQNAIKNKLTNWITLNEKLLKRLVKIHLSNDDMEKLAASRPGAIENLLFQIKHALQKQQFVKLSKHDTDISDDPNYSNEDLDKIRIRISNGDEAIEEKLSVEEIGKKLEELREKSEAMMIMTQKLEHLERLIQIKNERINQLNQQLNKSK